MSFEERELVEPLDTIDALSYWRTLFSEEEARAEAAEAERDALAKLLGEALADTRIGKEVKAANNDLVGYMERMLSQIGPDVFDPSGEVRRYLKARAALKRLRGEGRLG